MTDEPNPNPTPPPTGNMEKKGAAEWALVAENAAIAGAGLWQAFGPRKDPPPPPPPQPDPPPQIELPPGVHRD